MLETGITQDQWTILAILLGTVLMFLFGRWRHDMVAFAALLACVIAGLVPPSDAFSGFGHPAVVTVACVLVLSQSLQNSGAVDVLARSLLPANAGRLVTLSVLMGLGAFLSGFMNNVGAMALLMPVAIQLAQKLELTPGQVLMPLAFGTILGGMTTLIGTPPNLIVAGFREEAGLGSFRMFDFAPIGVAVAVVGVIFIAVIGWRLVPARKQTGVEGFESGAYLTEVRVVDSSKVVDKRLRDVRQQLDEIDVQIVGIVRNELRIIAPHPGRLIQVDDILIVEAEAESLSELLSIMALELVHDEPAILSEPDESDEEKGQDGSDKQPDKPKAASDDVTLVELAVLPNSSLCGRVVENLSIQTSYGINLLALSREGNRTVKRLRLQTIQSGDLLLLQGHEESINAFSAHNGCVPLAQRDLRIPKKRNAIVSSTIMLAAIGLAAIGLLPAVVSFALAVLASLALKTMQLRKVYDAVDWSVIVLLAGLIPVASAIQSTGTADIIARFLLESVAQGNAIVGLILILVVTMFLSDLMNNAATAAVMCPIAIGTSTALNVSPDSFLMAVAIGASCAFLTPIGHQNNTLILGPGGFRFSDYWRLGLPLELLVIAVSVPLLLIIWPL
jgi:di/tricarboxylate transporter